MTAAGNGILSGGRGRILLAGVFVLGVVLGAILLGRGGSPGGAPAEEHGHASAAADEDGTIWTCSMHPQIQMHEPGQCPICGMDLIPMEQGGGDDSPIRLSMSEASMKLAEVATVPVRRRFVEAEVRTVGRVAVDERRLKKITAWVPGRLERLFVDFTGISVKKGEHLVQIYSPELYSAQAELSEAVKARAGLGKSDTGFLLDTADATVVAAREKLRLLGLTDRQIADFEKSGDPSERITVYSPIGGIVIHKNALEGAYVKTGSPIYTIADLSHVWVLLDVYESDLPWIHFGQKVSFEVEAYPGEPFEGTIAFIDPTVDPKTRTVTVRVNADNHRLRLKPDMFVRAVIRSRVAGDGRAIAPELAGKWIGPMHPEIVKDHPGNCDICGMPLVPASELGFSNEKNPEPPLVIPDSAPLITGKRGVVYVRVPGKEKPTFEGREIVLGPRAGGSYAVLSGLKEGEEVVAKGNFKIDSAMQIQAKPSMMSPEGGAPPPAHHHGGASAPVEGGASESAPAPAKPDESGGSAHGDGASLPEPAELNAQAGAHGGMLLKSLAPAFDAYFEFNAALNEDDPAAGAGALGRLTSILNGFDTGMVSANGDAWYGWKCEAVAAAQAAGAQSSDLTALRAGLPRLSQAFLAVERAIGPPGGGEHRLVFCPMAFDKKGAYWLQRDTVVRKPYYGQAMSKCGSVKETFTGADR